MGREKPLELLSGRPLLHHIRQTALAECQRVIIVVGPGAGHVARCATEGLDEAMRRRTVVVTNPDPSRGMITTILVGLSHVRSEWFFVVPADMPFVGSRVWHELADRVAASEAVSEAAALEAAVPEAAAPASPDAAAPPSPDAAAPPTPDAISSPEAIFPIHGERTGHPVLIRRSVYARLVQEWRHYRSMGAFLRSGTTTSVPVAHAGSYFDVDTPEALAEARRVLALPAEFAQRFGDTSVQIVDS